MKIFFRYAAAAVLIIVLFGWLGTWLAEDWLERKLKEEVRRSSQGQLVLALDELTLSIFGPRLHIRGIRLQTSDSLQAVEVQLQLPDLWLRGVEWGSLLRKGPVVLEHLRLKEPRLHLKAADSAALKGFFKRFPKNKTQKGTSFRLDTWELQQAQASLSMGANQLSITQLQAAGSLTDSLPDRPGYFAILRQLAFQELKISQADTAGLFIRKAQLRRKDASLRLTFDTLHLRHPAVVFGLQSLQLAGQIPAFPVQQEPLKIERLEVKKLWLQDFTLEKSSDSARSASKPAMEVHINQLALPFLKSLDSTLSGTLAVEGRELQIKSSDSLPLQFHSLQIKTDSLRGHEKNNRLELKKTQLIAEENQIRILKLNGLNIAYSGLHLELRELELKGLDLISLSRGDTRVSSLLGQGIRLEGKLPEARKRNQDSEQAAAFSLGELQLTDVQLNVLGPKNERIRLASARLKVENLQKRKRIAWQTLSLHVKSLQFKAAKAPDAWQVSGMQLENDQASLQELRYGSPKPESLGPTRYYFAVDRLDVYNANWQALLNSQGFTVDSVFLHQPQIHAAKDKNKPSPEEIKPLPAAMLKSIKMPLYIRAFAARGGKIRYEERNVGADTAGVIPFDRLALEGFNLTNMESHIRKEEDFRLNVRLRIMEQAPLFTRFRFNLQSPQQPVQIEGGVDSLQLTDLNPMVSYVAPVVIQGGRLHKARWRMQGNDSLMSGSLNIAFDSLSMELSPPNSADSSGIFKEIGAFFIKKALLNEEQAFEETFRFANQAERTHGFIHYYWKTLLVGLKESMDLPAKNEKE